MWGFGEDYDRTYGALDDFRRRMDRLFEGFEIFKLEDREQRAPGAWHWYLVAERGPDAASRA